MVVGDASMDIDVLVIGGGPGGYVAAIRAAQLGKQVVIVDKSGWGGVCLHRGCIPSKALIAAAHQVDELKYIGKMGISVTDIKVDFSQVQAWKQAIIHKQMNGVQALLQANQIQMFQGEAMLINEHEARLFNDQEAPRYRFKHCILATGSRPVELKTFPFGGRIVSSTEALQFMQIPKSLIVIGGGYIGIELGQAYAKFGTKVTILEGSDHILSSFEKEMTKLVANQLQKSGVTMITESRALHGESTQDTARVTYLVHGEEKQLEAEYVLVTVGRIPNTDGDLGLERLGVERTERGLIAVDQQGRTKVPHIFAIGDIVAGPSLAHKASYEAKVAAEAIAGLPSVVDYRAIPTVVFSDPEIASVGLTETEAKAKQIPIVIGKFPYAANGRAQALQATEGFVKLISHAETGVMMGAQIIGAEASQLIGELGLAIEMGAHVEDIALTIHAHPTLSEMVMDAAEGALGHPIHQMPKTLQKI